MKISVPLIVASICPGLIPETFFYYDRFRICRLYNKRRGKQLKEKVKKTFNITPVKLDYAKSLVAGFRLQSRYRCYLSSMLTL